VKKLFLVLICALFLLESAGSASAFDVLCKGVIFYRNAVTHEDIQFSFETKDRAYIWAINEINKELLSRLNSFRFVYVVSSEEEYMDYINNGPDPDELTETHFVTFVENSGLLCMFFLNNKYEIVTHVTFQNHLAVADMIVQMIQKTYTIKIE